MAKTIEQLKAQSAEVKNASVIGENTATRVGSLFNDIVEHVEAYEAGQAQKDTEQSTSINAETARATEAETTLSERINQEVTERKAMDETIGVQLSNEIKRAKEMELGISTKLNDEIGRAQETENDLQEKITSEAEARDLAINNEAQARTQNDQLLSQAIAAEQERAEAAEQANAQVIEAVVVKNEEQDQKLSELEEKIGDTQKEEYKTVAEKNANSAGKAYFENIFLSKGDIVKIDTSMLNRGNLLIITLRDVNNVSYDVYYHPNDGDVCIELSFDINRITVDSTDVSNEGKPISILKALYPIANNVNSLIQDGCKNVDIDLSGILFQGQYATNTPKREKTSVSYRVSTEPIRVKNAIITVDADFSTGLSYVITRWSEGYRLSNSAWKTSMEEIDLKYNEDFSITFKINDANVTTEEILSKVRTVSVKGYVDYLYETDAWEFTKKIDSIKKEVESHEERIKALEQDTPQPISGSAINFMQKYYLDNKIAQIPEGKSFVFVTDTHVPRNAGKSLDYIKYVIGKTGIRNVIFGGDAFDREKTKELAELALLSYSENFYNAFGDKGIWVQGNHDANVNAYASTPEPLIPADSEWKELISNKTVFVDTVQPIAHKIVFDTEGISRLDRMKLTVEEKEEMEYWMKLHYYYDDNHSKIRYVVMEGCNSSKILKKEGGFGTGNTYVFHYDWLAKTLIATPDDYDIVIVSHQIGNETSVLQSSDLILAKILMNFKVHGRSGYNPIVGSTEAKAKEWWNLTDQVVDADNKNIHIYDFSGKSTFTGKILMICGHFHLDDAFICQSNSCVEYDEVTTIESDAIPFIWTSTDAWNATSSKGAGWSGTSLQHSVSPKMELGKNTEQCFDVYTIKENGDIAITRFGAGEDRYINMHK